MKKKHLNTLPILNTSTCTHKILFIVIHKMPTRQNHTIYSNQRGTYYSSLEKKKKKRKLLFQNNLTGEMDGWDGACPSKLKARKIKTLKICFVIMPASQQPCFDTVPHCRAGLRQTDESELCNTPTAVIPCSY